MDRQFSVLLQVISLVMFAWMANSWLTQLHRSLGFLLLVFTAANVMTVWGLRRGWSCVKSGVQIPFMGRYLAFVCRFSGEPLPASGGKAQPPGFLLRSKEDFALASRNVKTLVRGHDRHVDQLLAKLHENVLLRKRNKNSRDRGPLASFLLAGPNGIGKGYLASALARVTHGGSFDTFDCERTTTADLIGQAGQSGALATLQRIPHRTLLFEHVDRAPSDLKDFLTRVLLGESPRLPESNVEVTFEHAIVLFTVATKADEGSEDLQAEPKEPTHHHPPCLEHIDSRLLHALTEILLFCTLDDQVKSEIVALLLVQECRKHRTELTHVAPEIVATQVLQIDDEDGLGPTPPRVRKLLRAPLVAAAEGDHRSLSLRVR